MFLSIYILFYAIQEQQETFYKKQEIGKRIEIGSPKQRSKHRKAKYAS